MKLFSFFLLMAVNLFSLILSNGLNDLNDDWYTYHKGDNEEEYSYEDDGYEYADDIGSEPNIFTVPQTAYLKNNETIELPCEGENLGSYSITWKQIHHGKDQKRSEPPNKTKMIAVGETLFDKDERYRVVTNADEFEQGSTLIISSTKFSDKGVWECEVVTPSGTYKVNHTLFVTECDIGADGQCDAGEYCGYGGDNCNGDYCKDLKCVPNPTPKPASDNCDACVKSFSEAGGCECIKNEECDQLSLIPDGCFKCGNKAMGYCSSQAG